MKRLCSLLLIAAAALIPALAQNSKPFIGRWDMTVSIGTGQFPSWLEITEKGAALEAGVQQPTGNVAPVPGARVEGVRLIVTTSTAAPERPAEGNRPAVAARPETVWELTAKGDKLTGI